jgi:hypothetical protein
VRVASSNRIPRLCHAMKPSLSGGGIWRVSAPCAICHATAAAAGDGDTFGLGGERCHRRGTRAGARLRRDEGMIDEECIAIRSSDCATLVGVASCAVLDDADMLYGVNGGSCEVNVKSQVTEQPKHNMT